MFVNRTTILVTNKSNCFKKSITKKSSALSHPEFHAARIKEQGQYGMKETIYKISGELDLVTFFLPNEVKL